MRFRIALVACAALALAVGAATAAADGGGNSEAAKACQKDGWKNLVRAEDASSFKNTGDCVSYAARGGTPTPKTQSQLDCESFGGTFSVGPSPNYAAGQGTAVWSCAGYSSDGINFLTTDCFLGDGPGNGNAFGIIDFFATVQDSSCVNTNIS